MMLYDVLWCCMMLYDVIAVDFIPELCVFQLNAKLKPSYIPCCGIFPLESGHLGVKTTSQVMNRRRWPDIGTAFIKRISNDPDKEVNCLDNDHKKSLYSGNLVE